MMSAIGALGVLAVIGVVAVGLGATDMPFSATDAPGIGGDDTDAPGCGFLSADVLPAAADNCGADATVNVGAEDLADSSEPRVTTDVYATQLVADRQNIDLNNKETTPSSRAEFTMARGDKAQLVAFDDTHPYGFVHEEVLNRETLNLNIPTVTGASSVDVSMYDEDNNQITGAQSFGEGQAKTWSELRMTVSESDAAYNLGIIAAQFNGTDDSTVDEVNIKDSAVTEMDSCPDAYSNQDVCFRYDPRVGLDDEPAAIPQDHDVIHLNDVVVNIADGEDPSNDAIEWTVDDYATFKNSDNDNGDLYEYGVEDENGNLVGMSAHTLTTDLE